MRVFQIEDGYVMLYRGKGSNRTSQKLVEDSDELFNEKAALTAYVTGKPKNELLFPFSRQWANRLTVRYGQEAGIPKAKLHLYSLRHSIAHHLLAVSDLPTVQRRLGHKSISSTSFYVQTTDEKASEAVEQLTTKP
jgi:site-specific recombinase XerD